ncbi:MAG: ExeM/NucH family extracellular endonuclease, partial [Marmoricola sp.]
DTFTVTDTFSTNQYAEIGLATGTRPLLVPTEVADAQDTAAIAAVVADNQARGVVLDDGASLNFLSAANQSVPLPWLSPANPVRVGARAAFVAPVVLDYRNDTWKFQPQQRVTDDGRSVVDIANTRSTKPEAVPGNLHLATFNVLNYFNTVGVDYAAAGHSCSYFDDRAGNHNTVDDCGPTGPRGAAEADDLARQQAKIVAAINALGADVVSLEEIENSVALGEPNRDDALSTLVDALNAAAGSTRWAFAPSPAASDLPPVAEQDVIRTAFIYDPSTISLVGASKVLVGSAAFANAREPLAQAFKPKGSSDASTFAVVVNHFKSKGSGVDDHTGQGNANPDRVAQAQALVPFADAFAADRGTDRIFLSGDFNSYSQEDPLQVLYGAGFAAINSDDPGEWTYSFGGESGSLDHVLANPAAHALVAGADVWGINSGESVAWEYSRTNYNVSDLYQPNMFRASDHDPEIVGLNLAAQQPVVVTADAQSITYGQPDPAFTFTATGFASGDGFSTPPVCGVAGPHAAAGTYPVTCSGGTTSSGYDVSYVAGTLTVAKAPVTVTTTATSAFRSLLTFRVTYTSVVRSTVTGLPVAGVTVVTRIDDRGPGSGCTAVTSATGTATCTAGPGVIVLGRPAYTASASEGANTLAGTGRGRIPYL